MYKYRKIVSKRGKLQLVLYYLFVLRMKEYKDGCNIRLYAKINWWHPIIILMTIYLVVGAIVKDVIKIIAKDLIEFLKTNNEDHNKGIFIGYLREE